MPRSRRRTKKAYRPKSSGWGAPRDPGSDWLARLQALVDLPESDAKWAEISALVAEVKASAPSYTHLPPTDQLKAPADRPATQGDWHVASERVREAYELIRVEVERLGSRLRQELTISYTSSAAAGQTDRLSFLVADSRDTYLATKEVDDGTDSDIYRYAAGNLDALRRVQKLRAERRRERVTPGYRWWMDRADDAGRRETMKITLTVNADGVAQLRCGNRITPSTAAHWAELTAGALPPRPTPTTTYTSPPRQRRPRTKRLIVALFRTVFSFDFWFVLLLLALIVSIGAIIVMALLKL